MAEVIPQEIDEQVIDSYEEGTEEEEEVVIEKREHVSGDEGAHDSEESLPEYVYASNSKAKQALEHDLRYENVASVQFEILNQMIKYALKHKNPHIPVADFCKSIKGYIKGLSIDENTKTQTISIIQTLVRLDYCDITETIDKEPIEIVLKNKGEVKREKVESLVMRYVDDFFASPDNLIDRARRQDTSYIELPSVESVAAHLEVEPAQVEKVVYHIDNPDDFLDEVLAEVGKEHKIACISFYTEHTNEAEAGKKKQKVYKPDFNMLLDPKKPLRPLIQTFFVNIILSYFLAKESNYQFYRASWVKHRNQVRLRVPDLRDHDDLKRILSEVNDSDSFYYSAFILSKLLEQTKTKFPIIYQVAKVVYQYSSSLRAKLTRKKNAEREYKADIIELVRKMISECFETVPGSSRVLYRMCSIDEIAEFRDVRQQTILSEKYPEGVYQMLPGPKKINIKTEQGVKEMEVPEILSMKFGEKIYYFPRIRFISIVMSEIFREAMKVERKLVEKWSEDGIVKQDRFEDEISSVISEDFTTLLDFFNQHRRAYSDKQFAQIYYPGDRDVTLYNLAGSDLVEPVQFDGNNLNTPLKKLKYLVDASLYNDTENFVLKDYSKILNLNYASIRDAVKSQSTSDNWAIRIAQFFITIPARFASIFARVNIAMASNAEEVDSVVRYYDGPDKFKRALRKAASRKKDRLNIKGESRALFANNNTPPDGDDNAQDISSPKSPTTKKADAKKKLEKLKSVAPLAGRPDELDKIIAEEEAAWNNRLGNAKKETKANVDDVVLSIARRFDISSFAENNASQLASRIIKNNKSLEAISNRKSLSRYIYALALKAKIDAIRGSAH